MPTPDQSPDQWRLQTPDYRKQAKVDIEEKKEKTVEAAIEGKPYLVEKQKTELYEGKQLSKDEQLKAAEQRTCKHCGSIEHRSYNCPKLKDPEFLKERMEELKQQAYNPRREKQI